MNGWYFLLVLVLATTFVFTVGLICDAVVKAAKEKYKDGRNKH